MTGEEALAFATEWIDTWNRKDFEGVLAHFADDVCFTSPKAAATVGLATVEGKAALRAYWQAGMARIQTIEFTLDHPVWDPATRELLVLYTADFDGQRNRAGELMRFGDAGLVVRGEALYGATV